VSEATSPLSEPKLILSITPEEIFDSFLRIEDMIVADDLVRTRYHAKFVKWAGDIDEIRPGIELDHVSWNVTFVNYSNLKCYVVALIPRETTRYLRIGRRVTLFCNIADISRDIFNATIMLNNCELIETGR
jgi:hypothetical protein